MNDLEREIERTENEIHELKIQLMKREAYLEGLLKADKIQEKSANKSSLGLRSGTTLHKTMLLIRENGAPMHIDQILKQLGIPNTQAAKVSLVGSLGSYFRRNLIFTRPKPNTFGLIDMNPQEDDFQDLGTRNGKFQSSNNEKVSEDFF